MLTFTTSFAMAQECTVKKEMAAEQAANTAYSWDSLYQAYKKFSNCDSGGAAEIFDDKAMKLLAWRWKTAARLFDLCEQDKGFKQFVLNHISATGDPKDIYKLKKNAIFHCPTKNKELCEMIIKRADIAIKTLREYGIQ